MLGNILIQLHSLFSTNPMKRDLKIKFQFLIELNSIHKEIKINIFQKYKKKITFDFSGSLFKTDLYNVLNAVIAGS